MTPWPRAALAALVGVLLVGPAAGCGDGAGADVLGPGEVAVELRLHHSRFVPEDLTVEEGTTVRFVIHNVDPIDHEFIVGGGAVHARHEKGNEAEHGAVAGEVSVPAGETRSTTFRFDRPGTVVYACHLPKHLSYGMEGEVTVTPR